MTDHRSLLTCAKDDDSDMDLSSCCSDEESLCSMDESCCDSFDGGFLLEDDCVEASQVSAKAATTPSSASIVRETIKLLHSDHKGFNALELGMPISDAKDFSMILHGIQRNRTIITECSVSSSCFQSLSTCQRRELVFALLELSSLKSLVMDKLFPEFLYICNDLRCWKRDNYYRQHQRYCEFENRSLELLQITEMPANVSHRVLFHLVTMTVHNFATLQHLNVIFDGEFTQSQGILARAALTALSCSRSLQDVKFGYEDEFGEYNTLLELDASRNENVLKVLKVGCGEDQLSDHSYMELAQMLRMNSQTLRGLVLDTAVNNTGAITIANTLGQSNSLKALCLGSFDCHDKSERFGLLSLLSQVLCPPQAEAGACTLSSLEYLSLVCQELDDEGVEQISKCFAQSQLKELMLFMDNEKESGVTAQGISALAHVFRTNRTIQEFSLITHTLDDENVIAFSQALKTTGCTLKRLKLRCSKAFRVTSKVYKSVIEMLKTNSTLESIQLCRCPGSEEDEDFVECAESRSARLLYMPEIDFYLGLNQAGIRNLHLNVNSSPKQFRSAISCHRYDLNKVFYMLSANPSFVAFGA